MIRAEVTERKAVQVPAVGGVAKGTEICVVRGDDESASTRSEKAVKLFHGANHVGYVLDHVNGPDFPKGVVRERKRKVIQVGDRVCVRTCIPVYADGPGMLFYAATDVKNRKSQAVPANIS